MCGGLPSYKKPAQPEIPHTKFTPIFLLCQNSHHHPSIESIESNKILLTTSAPSTNPFPTLFLTTPSANDLHLLLLPRTYSKHPPKFSALPNIFFPAFLRGVKLSVTTYEWSLHRFSHQIYLTKIAVILATPIPSNTDPYRFLIIASPSLPSLLLSSYKTSSTRHGSDTLWTRHHQKLRFRRRRPVLLWCIEYAGMENIHGRRSFSSPGSGSTREKTYSLVCCIWWTWWYGNPPFEISSLLAAQL